MATISPINTGYVDANEPNNAITTINKSGYANPIAYWGNNDQYNTLFRFNKNDFLPYSKKVVNAITIEVKAWNHYFGNNLFGGGSIGWLSNDYSESTTWNTQPGQETIDYKYVTIPTSTQQNYIVSFDFSIPIYKKGYIGKNGGSAPRRLLDQLWIGFVLSNSVSGSDKKSSVLQEIEVGGTYTYIKLSIETSDWTPTLIARSPISSAYIKPSIDNKFSVSFDEFQSIDYPTVQTVTYDTKDTATGTITTHTASVSINLKDRTYIEWTMPADTLPSGKTWQWRAKLTTDDSETGYSDWADFTTVDAVPNAPTIIYPQSKYLVGEEPITLKWQHNISTGSEQHAYDLQYRQTGDWISIKTHEISNAQSYTLPANFFAAGTMYWRVRTYNTDDTYGGYSTSSANVIQARPVTPIISNITSAPRLTVDWQSTGQEAYQLTITDSSGNTAYDTGEEYGVIKSVTIDDYLSDDNYTICLKIQNGLGLWSECATIVVKIVDEIPPGDDILTATSILGGVMLRLTIPLPTGAHYLGDDIYIGEVYLTHEPYYTSGTRYLLRDGVPIAKMDSTTYTDYSASAEGHEYKVRITSDDGNYHDTNTVNAAALINYGCISKLQSPQNVIVLKLNEDNAAKIEGQSTMDYTALKFAGRKLPVYDLTGQYNGSYTFAYAMLTLAEYEALKQLMLDGDTVIYRNKNGLRVVGTLVSLKPTFKHRGHVTFEFVIEATDVDEAISYD